MRDILNIALNDLRAVLRERSTLITIFVVPVAMTIFLGFAFGASSSVGVIDVLRPDAGDQLSTQFVELLRTESGKQLIVCDLVNLSAQPAECNLGDLKSGTDLRATAEDRVKNGATLAAVALPTQFTADLQAGKSIAIGYIVKGGLNAPQLIRQKVEAVRTRFNGALLAARVVTDQAKPAEDQRQVFSNGVYAAAESIWATNPIVIDEQTPPTANGAAGLGFGQSAPGIGAMFVLTSALGLATVFITERQNWTLQRLMVLPLARWQILAGKLLGRYLLALITFALMIGVGTLFKVQWGDWLGLILVVMTYTLAVTALGLAVSTLVRSPQQAVGISLLATMTLAPLGGAWWSLSIVPNWMQAIGHISPIAWSQDAFSKMIFYGGHLVDVLPSIGVLLLFAVVFFAFGLSRFRFE